MFEMITQLDRDMIMSSMIELLGKVMANHSDELKKMNLFQKMEIESYILSQMELTIHRLQSAGRSFEVYKSEG